MIILWTLFLIAEIVGTVSAIVATMKEDDDLFLCGYFMIMVPAILLLILY